MYYTSMYPEGVGQAVIVKTASLTEAVLAVVRDQGTELPFTGEYDHFTGPGTYLCRQCGLALFRSQTKFHSACGWPSFDEEIAGHVAKRADADGRRVEIVCARCLAHLGHVFSGEGLTSKNTRHCVNSVSLDYVTDLSVIDTEEAIFAGGCFWGVESLFKQLAGVCKTEVGYSGGKVQHPSYEMVCRGDTGHYEVVRVVYDPSVVTYAEIATYFFEIHDPTQGNGQGPDRGTQYLSAAFYYDEIQRQILLRLIAQLEEQGFSIATHLQPAQTFWRAEEYHQSYYQKTGKHPYCHAYTKRFNE